MRTARGCSLEAARSGGMLERIGARSSIWRWTLILPLLALAGTAQASVVDQQNLNTGGGLNTGLEWQQQVTDGIGGVLAGVVLYGTSYIYDTGNDIGATVSIGLGSGWYTGSFAFTTTATLTPGGTFIDTSAANIVLTPGEAFVIDVSGGSGHALGSSSYPSPAYSGGDLYENGTDFTVSHANNDSLTFQTFIDASSAPEPGTMVLLGVGLFGLAWMRRRRARYMRG